MYYFNKKLNVGHLITITSLLLFFGGGTANALTYGGTGAGDTFYSTDPILFNNGDQATGFVAMAGGFHVADSASILISNVSTPIAKDIYIYDSSTLTVEGDLTLSTTSIEANGGFIFGCDGTLFLDKDTVLPGQTITLGSDVTIDGQNNIVTFNSSTIFSLSSCTLTLKNMIIKGLATSSQFSGPGTLVFQNCIIDIPMETTFGCNTANLSIKDMVVVQGGGTFQFSGLGTMTIEAFSTLYIDLASTFDYGCNTNSLLTFSATSSSLHINGGTLKAQGATGLNITTGRLVLENKVTLDNGANTNLANGIQLGDGTDDLAVNILAGAYVMVQGCVWHNPEIIQ